jgi:hypothetical protein
LRRLRSKGRDTPSYKGSGIWPLYRTKGWSFWKDLIIDLAGEEIYERIEFYFRAKLLDEVIDVLADYIDGNTSTRLP